MDTDGMFIHISHLKKKKKNIYIYIFVISIRFLYVSCMRRDSDCLCQEGLWETGVSTRHSFVASPYYMSCHVMWYHVVSFHFTILFHNISYQWYCPFRALWRFSAWLEHRSTPGSDFGAGHGWFFWDRNQHESSWISQQMRQVDACLEVLVKGRMPPAVPKIPSLNRQLSSLSGRGGPKICNGICTWKPPSWHEPVTYLAWQE